MAIMMVGLVFLGLYPQPLFDMVNPALASLHQFSGAAEAWMGSSP